jgi:hypothetical protein
VNRPASYLLLAALGLALAGCPGLPEAPKQAAPKARKAVSLTDRLPKRAELVCFPCHSQQKFERGPFPHKNVAHKGAGHCHTCHMGSAHEGRTIDRTACITCHEEGSEELQLLSKSGTPGK